MRRQLLEPIGSESVEGVVRRLGAVQAQFNSAHRARCPDKTHRQRSRPGEVARALADGQIAIKTFAFRGATHLMTPEDGGRLPGFGGSQSDVGAPELAELLQPGAIRLAAP